MKYLLLALLLNGIIFANENKELSAEVRGLLIQEMQAVKQGMDDILFGIVSNDYGNIASVATKIHNSFILKQKLTKKQRKELQTKLPKDFFTQDQAFHKRAEDLANTAEFADKKETLIIYASMINQCVKCHETYATHKFNYDD